MLVIDSPSSRRVTISGYPEYTESEGLDPLNAYHWEQSSTYKDTPPLRQTQPATFNIGTDCVQRARLYTYFDKDDIKFEPDDIYLVRIIFSVPDLFRIYTIAGE